MQLKSPCRTLTAVNVHDIRPADDAFTTLETRTPLDWIRLSGLPASRVELRFRGIRLSRYRAALEAARAARRQPDSLLISHLPLMSAAVSTILMATRSRVPHLSFAFSFSTMPTGLRLKYLRRALRLVDQFAPFSQFERTVYSELLGVDPARVVPVIWTQGAPPVQSAPGLAMSGKYLCAIGGEGRDFPLILDLARRLGAATPIVIIARPDSLKGLSVPDHVVVLTNIPLDRVWRIAADSQGVLLPLRSRETCGGHVTMVSAKLLGIPVVTTYAHATREYVDGRVAVLECEPGEPGSYYQLVERLLDNGETYRSAAQAQRQVEGDFHNRRRWAAYLDTFIATNLCR